MKKGLSIQISIEFEYDPETMNEMLISDLFPKLSRAIDSEGWTIDNIEFF